MTSGVNASFGAVRNLYTPVGGTRVVDLAELLSGKTYVASGGARTKFQKIEYGAKPRPRRARSQVHIYYAGLEWAWWDLLVRRGLSIKRWD